MIVDTGIDRGDIEPGCALQRWPLAAAAGDCGEPLSDHTLRVKIPFRRGQDLILLNASISNAHSVHQETSSGIGQAYAHAHADSGASAVAPAAVLARSKPSILVACSRRQP